MPGGTAKYGLPYLRPDEPLYTIAKVTQLLAERLETLISNGTIGSSGSGATATAGPAASITLATPASVDSGSIYFAFNNSGKAEYDLRSAGGAQTHANGVIASKAGIYHISIVMPWGTNNANGQRVIKLIDEATGNTIGEDVRPGSSIEQISQISVVLPLTAGQKLNCYVYQNSGTALTVGGTQQGGIKTRFSITWLGAST